MEFLSKNIGAETFIIVRNILLTIFIGYAAIHVLVIITRHILWKHLTQQWKMLISKGIIYTGVIIVLMIILDILKLKISAILGAAGILGVVVGFASQTSIGNIISGLFLITEKPFEVGDLITVGDKTGNVYSIDLLSIKLKTLDNLLIRIPNQTIISTEVTNVTRFPIRRMDINIGVAYNSDLKKVIETLRTLAMENPDVLNEPEPLILIKDFGESSIDLIYGIWFEKSNYLKVRNSIMQSVKETFEKEGIEIPFPHRTIYYENVNMSLPRKKG